MSAAIFLQQREVRTAYLLTDAAEYFADGTIHEFVDKCEMIETAHCALTVLGPAAWQEIIADAIRENFDGYDAVRDGIEPLARRLFEQYVDAIRWEVKTAELWVVGWSRSQNRPEAFTLALCGDAEWEVWLRREPGMTRRPFVPEVQHVAINANPAPSAAEIYAAKFPAIDPEQYDPELDMLHMMEIMRRHRFTGKWPFLVGGYALLTTVDAVGVTQRRIATWPEDRVGQRIKPKPIDWQRWRAGERKPLTRLQAQVALRKQAKARRRAMA